MQRAQRGFQPRIAWNCHLRQPSPTPRPSVVQLHRQSTNSDSGTAASTIYYTYIMQTFPARALSGVDHMLYKASTLTKTPSQLLSWGLSAQPHARAGLAVWMPSWHVQRNARSQHLAFQLSYPRATQQLSANLQANLQTGLISCSKQR